MLKTVVSQRLMRDTSGSQVPAFEIMRVNSGIQSLIRESKTHQIDNVLQSSGAEGMIGMDGYILGLAADGIVTKDTALEHAANPGQMARRFEELAGSGRG